MTTEYDRILEAAWREAEDQDDFSNEHRIWLSGWGRAWQAALSAQPVPQIASNICRAVAELPDRNSPQDWPEAMLVTQEELAQIVIEALGATYE